MGKSQIASKALAVQAAAYTAGQVVGGILDFPLAFDVDYSGVLQSVTLKSKIVLTSAFDLYLFAGGAAHGLVGTYTDKVVPTFNAADLAALLGVVSLSSAKSGLGTMTVYESGPVGKVVRSGFTTLYGVLVCINTPTFASTSDLILDLGLLKD